MANSKQAGKRARQAEKSRQNNRWQQTRFMTHIKKVLVAVASGNQAAAQAAYQEAASIVDRLASKGIIHRNKANRHKSRLNTRIKAMGSAA